MDWKSRVDFVIEVASHVTAKVCTVRGKYSQHCEDNIRHDVLSLNTPCLA